MVKMNDEREKNQQETQAVDKLNTTETNEKNSREKPATNAETDTTPITPETTQTEELLKIIDDLKSENEQLKDRYLRKAAEFENFKRRMDQESLSIKQYATESLILDILPILDDFERSLRISKERREFGAFYKGVELIYQKFLKSLEAKGLTPITAVGKQFDVDLHDALLQIPKDDIEPHTVVEEIERGYKLHDRVIRHSKVIVASPPESDSVKTPDSRTDDSSTEDDN
jgi:molecular chaperone GrpE